MNAIGPMTSSLASVAMKPAAPPPPPPPQQTTVATDADGDNDGSGGVNILA